MSLVPRPRRPLPVVKLPHETFLMSNHGDLRLSPSVFLFLSLSLFSLPSRRYLLFVHTTISLSRSLFVGLSPVSYFCRPFSRSPSYVSRLAVCLPRVAFPSFVFPRNSHRPTPSWTREQPRWSPRRSSSCAKEVLNVGLRASRLRRDKMNELCYICMYRVVYQASDFC